MALALAKDPAVESAPANVLQLLPVASIHPNPRNPRKDFQEEALQELATSIREVGILQPLVVVPAGPDQYRLVAGERRWRAAHIAGLEEVPALIRELTPEQEAQVMLIENLQRRDLNAIEEAQAYQELIAEHGYTQETLAAKIGVSQGQISNRIRLLGLPAAVTENISRGILSPGHGRALAGLKNVPTDLVTKIAEEMGTKEIPVARAADYAKTEIAHHGRPLTKGYWAGFELKFDPGECDVCGHRAMGRLYGDKDKPFCLKPSCWNKKQAEAEQRIRDKAITAMDNGALVITDRLSQDDFRYWQDMQEYPGDSSYYDQTECQACPKRKLGKRQRDKMEDASLLCLDPKCMERKMRR